MRQYLQIILICMCFSASAQKDSILIDQAYENYSKGSEFVYKNLDSARKYFAICYDLGNTLEDTNFKLSILNSLVISDSYHFRLSEFKEDIDLMDSIMKNDSHVDTLKFKKEYQKILINSYGDYYYLAKNFSAAKPYFNRLLTLLDSIDERQISSFDLSMKFTALEYLGNIARREGKNEVAKQYYNRILKYYENKPEGLEERMYGVKYRLSRIYEGEKNFQKANMLQKEALAFYKSESSNTRNLNNLKSNYQALIKNYLFQDSLDIALQYLEESRPFYKEEDPFLKEKYLLYADVYAAKKDYEKAEAYLNEALEATKTYRNHQKHQDIAEIYARFGKLHLKQYDFEKSLEYYQQALMQLSTQFDDKELTKNPDPRQVFSKLELVKILKQKLEALQSHFQTNKKDPDALQIALTTSYTIIETLDLLRPEFESKFDKQFLISEMYPVFYSMVSVAYQLYQATGDIKYIEDGFYFIEKSKSILLLEAMHNARANNFGDIPEDILNKEQQYRANIIHLEKQVFDKGEDKIVLDSLFRLKNQYYDFITEIEQQYPRYYNLKYNNKVASLTDAQHMLDKHTGLLSYVAADTGVFTIAVQKHKASFYKISFDETLKTTIRSFYKDISNPKVNEIDKLWASGNTIYKKLLKVPLQEMKVNKLIILPDDILNYVPFDALSQDPDTSDYLIYEYQISYANSVTLFRAQQTKPKRKQNSLLAYAPRFGDIETGIQTDRSNFGPLRYNIAEAKNIANYFDGQAITGPDATIESFKIHSKTNNILHFATHAAANDQYPDYSYLAFASKVKNYPSLLYVKDLYAYTINADMVTLSACQTGLGKLQKGEGMLSLARGFSYAGARSLVTTLWKINDETTAEVMNDFYKNLNDGVAKDKALRDAKLQYLNTAEDELLKHPYYWSGFMLSGDTQPLKARTTKLWWLLLVIPILIVFARKRKKTTPTP